MEYMLDSLLAQLLSSFALALLVDFSNKKQCFGLIACLKSNRIYEVYLFGLNMKSFKKLTNSFVFHFT
jgi:hypothetical protein